MEMKRIRAEEFYLQGPTRTSPPQQMTVTTTLKRLTQQIERSKTTRCACRSSGCENTSILI